MSLMTLVRSMTFALPSRGPGFPQWKPDLIILGMLLGDVRLSLMWSRTLLWHRRVPWQKKQVSDALRRRLTMLIKGCGRPPLSVNVILLRMRLTTTWVSTSGASLLRGPGLLTTPLTKQRGPRTPLTLRQQVLIWYLTGPVLTVLVVVLVSRVITR